MDKSPSQPTVLVTSLVPLDANLLQALQTRARELDLDPDSLLNAAVSGWLEQSACPADEAEYQQLMRRLRFQVKKLLGSLKAGERRRDQPARQSLAQKWRKAIGSDTLLRNALEIIATSSVNLANLLSEGELPYIDFAETIALASLNPLERIQLLSYLAEFRSLDGVEERLPQAGLRFRQILRPRPVAAEESAPLRLKSMPPTQAKAGSDALSRAINRLHRRLARELAAALTEPPLAEWLTQAEKSPWMNSLQLSHPKLHQLLLHRVLGLRPAELRALDAARPEAQLTAIWNLAHFGTLMPEAARA